MSALESAVETDIGKFVKRRRTDLKMTLRDLEKRSGIDHSYISRIERGDQANLTVKVMEQLAYGLRTTFEVISRAARGLPIDDESAKVDATVAHKLADATPEEQNMVMQFLSRPPEVRAMLRKGWVAQMEAIEPDQ
jgi:transcriptional regulator with XRE-family HTH domain